MAFGRKSLRNKVKDLEAEVKDLKVEMKALINYLNNGSLLVSRKKRKQYKVLKEKDLYKRIIDEKSRLSS
jgi:hypothetical protein